MGFCIAANLIHYAPCYACMFRKLFCFVAGFGSSSCTARSRLHAGHSLEAAVLVGDLHGLHHCLCLFSWKCGQPRLQQADCAAVMFFFCLTLNLPAADRASGMRCCKAKHAVCYAVLGCLAASGHVSGSLARGFCMVYYQSCTACFTSCKCCQPLFCRAGHRGKKEAHTSRCSYVPPWWQQMHVGGLPCFVHASVSNQIPPS